MAGPSAKELLTELRKTYYGLPPSELDGNPLGAPQNDLTNVSQEQVQAASAALLAFSKAAPDLSAEEAVAEFASGLDEIGIPKPETSAGADVVAAIDDLAVASGLPAPSGRLDTDTDTNGGGDDPEFFTSPEQVLRSTTLTDTEKSLILVSQFKLRPDEVANALAGLPLNADTGGTGGGTGAATAESGRQFDIDFAEGVRQFGIEQEALLRAEGLTQQQIDAQRDQFAQNFAEQQRQFNQQFGLDSQLGQGRLALDTTLGTSSEARENSRLIAEILRNPSNILGSLFTQRGGTPPFQVQSQADLINNIANERNRLGTVQRSELDALAAQLTPQTPSTVSPAAPKSDVTPTAETAGNAGEPFDLASFIEANPNLGFASVTGGGGTTAPATGDTSRLAPTEASAPPAGFVPGQDEILFGSGGSAFDANPDDFVRFDDELIRMGGFRHGSRGLVDDKAFVVGEGGGRLNTETILNPTGAPIAVIPEDLRGAGRLRGFVHGTPHQDDLDTFLGGLNQTSASGGALGQVQESITAAAPAPTEQTAPAPTSQLLDAGGRNERGTFARDEFGGLAVPPGFEQFVEEKQFSEGFQFDFTGNPGGAVALQRAIGIPEDQVALFAAQPGAFASGADQQEAARLAPGGRLATPSGTQTAVSSPGVSGPAGAQVSDLESRIQQGIIDGTATQEDLVALGIRNTPTGVAQVLAGGTPSPQRFDFPLPTARQWLSLTDNEQQAMASRIALQYNVDINDVLFAINQRHSSPTGRSARLAL